VSPLRFVPIAVAEKLGRILVSNKNASLSLVAWVVFVFFLVPLIVIYVL